MKNQFFKRTAAFICALCIVSGGMPQLTGGLSLTKPGVTADAAKQHFESTVKFDKDTGILTLLEGNVSKNDVRDYADNAGVTKVVCEEGAVFPEDCEGMFEYFLAEEYDLTGADTSKVTNMYGMFDVSRAKKIDLSGWDTTKVENMANMFYACENVEMIDLTGWDTSNVTNMYAMFGICKKLTTVYVGAK